jgi:hypothetical protein
MLLFNDMKAERSQYNNHATLLIYDPATYLSEYVFDLHIVT